MWIGQKQRKRNIGGKGRLVVVVVVVDDE